MKLAQLVIPVEMPCQLNQDCGPTICAKWDSPEIYAFERGIWRFAQLLINGVLGYCPNPDAPTIFRVQSGRWEKTKRPPTRTRGSIGARSQRKREQFGLAVDGRAHRLRSPEPVFSVTVMASILCHSLPMEPIAKRLYKIVRTLADGQRVLIGTFEDESETRKRVAAFSEYWPGDYVIVPPNYEQRADR
jgi:hypothetical protein